MSFGRSHLREVGDEDAVLDRVATLGVLSHERAGTQRPGETVIDIFV